jgi:hypothetical protein
MSASILVRGFGLGYVATIKIMNNSHTWTTKAKVPATATGSVPELINTASLAVSSPPPSGPANYWISM